jgi:hypothetical protein
MKKQLAAIAVSILFGNGLLAQTKIALQDAARHVGEVVTVTAKVEAVRFYFRMDQRPVVFTLAAATNDDTASGAPKPLTLVVYNANKATYLETGKEWVKKNCTITGTVVLNNGSPQIEISKPEQVSVINSL